MQTNATLINDAWCDCFRRNRIVVGISVDGPEDIHDSHQRISEVTADAMEQPERMYRFFRDNGISEAGFNVEEQVGINTSSSMQGSGMEEKYRDFLRAFWRLSEQDSRTAIQWCCANSKG